LAVPGPPPGRAGPQAICGKSDYAESGNGEGLITPPRCGLISAMASGSSARAFLLLSAFALGACVEDQQSSFSRPVYGSPGSALGHWVAPAPLQPGAAWGPGPIELRPAPKSAPPEVTQPGSASPGMAVAPAPAPANADAGGTAAREPEQGSEGREELDRRLQQLKARLDAEQDQPPAPTPVSQPSKNTASTGSSLPTRPGFREHYGALNHSGDVPPHNPGVSP
jgi:hypothetical protein